MNQGLLLNSQTLVNKIKEHMDKDSVTKATKQCSLKLSGYSLVFVK